MKKASPAARAIVAALTVAALAFFLIGPDKVWTLAAGPGDQGAVDIATLARLPRPMDSLACTPPLCTGRLDFALPAYPDAPEALMRRLDAVVLADTRNLTRVDDGSDPAYRRYLARTAIMRFPDTVDARAAPLGAGSGLMLYGRAQLGIDDYGVNRRRLETWAAQLKS